FLRRGHGPMLRPNHQARGLAVCRGGLAPSAGGDGYQVRLRVGDPGRADTKLGPGFEYLAGRLPTAGLWIVPGVSWLRPVEAAPQRLLLAARIAPGDVLSPFTGRDRELAELRRLLGVAAGGDGQVVGLVGDPGLGKSRLALEFLRLAEDRAAVL